MFKHAAHRLIFILSLFFFFGSALPAAAAPLDDAKQKGLLGEMQTGYLGAVQQLPPDVQALMNDINQKRKAMYFEIAQKNGTAVSAVEALAAQKAIAQTPPGEYVQSPSGAWTKK